MARSPEVAQALFGAWVLELGYYRLREAQLDGIPLVVARTGWSGEVGFEIRASDREGTATVLVQPDWAPCAACLGDVARVGDRRHAYPFTNCTHCGPRPTIVNALPYDRPLTTMADFPLCRLPWEVLANPRLRRRYLGEPQDLETQVAVFGYY